MWRWLAACVIAVALTGCAQKAAFEELADGRCTSAQSELIDGHISGQIAALAKKDWPLAYSFASADFQARVGVDQFTLIIAAQYSMLIDNQGYQFEKCEIASDMIVQEVIVTTDEQVFNLTYRLSIKGSTLGVEAAIVNAAETKLNI